MTQLNETALELVKVLAAECESTQDVTPPAKKEMLGIWSSASESASFWRSRFNELKNRGVNWYDSQEIIDKVLRCVIIIDNALDFIADLFVLSLVPTALVKPLQ